MFRWSLSPPIIKAVIAAGFVLIGAGNLRAVPIPCPTDFTVAFAIANFNAAGGGCFVQDKIFNNWSYTGVAPNDAANANAHIVFQNIGVGQDIHGFLFTNIGVNQEWTAGFSLGYTITVCFAAPCTGIVPGETITQSKDQINTGAVPNSVAINDTQSAAGLITVLGTATGETVQRSYAGVTSVNTSSVATIPVGNLLLSYEQDFFESPPSGVPEPTTMILFGVGLAGLGILKRRRQA